MRLLPASLKKLSDLVKVPAGILGISIGVVMMMTSNVGGGRNFKLKAPEQYFDDPKSLALLNSSLAGNLVNAKDLVATGANPNYDGPRDNPYNRLRLLHYAIAAKNPHAVKILVEVGADPELNTIGGGGPAFLFAINLNDVEMLSLLLDLRPVSSLNADTVEDLLFESVVLSRHRCIDLLLKKGAPIDFPDKTGHTIMMRAMDIHDFDLAEKLILQGASVHVEGKGGLTPAYAVQFYLQKFKPGSPTHNKVLHLKQLMQARGAVFPAPSPAEVLARRSKHPGH
jgi:uncharacterized protein